MSPPFAEGAETDEEPAVVDCYRALGKGMDEG